MAKSSAAQLLPVFGLPARIVSPSATICGTAHLGSLNSRATRSAAEVSVNGASVPARLGFPRCAFHAASAAARGSKPSAAPICPIPYWRRDDDRFTSCVSPLGFGAFRSLLARLVGIGVNRQSLDSVQHMEGGKVAGAAAAPHRGEV